MASLHCIVVTPEETALELPTDFVVLPLYDGEIGIAVDHSPLIGRLGYGEMRLQVANETKRYYVDGGFVQVADNVVSVLTNRVTPAEELDEDAAMEQLTLAQTKPANSPELMEIRDRAVEQSRAQQRVAQRNKS